MHTSELCMCVLMLCIHTSVPCMHVLMLCTCTSVLCMRVLINLYISKQSLFISTSLLVENIVKIFLVYNNLMSKQH